MIYIAPEYRPWFARQGITTYTHLLSLCRGQLINSADKNATWRDELVLDEGRVGVFIKRYTYPPLLRYVYPRVPRALVELKSYQYWQQHNIPGPQPIAAGAYSPMGIHRSSLIVTREIVAARDLNDLGRDDEFCNNTALLVRVFDRLADLLVQTHQAHFYHYDLHFRNVMVQGVGEDPQAPKVYWIDAPRGKCQPPLIFRRYLQIKDLACIYRGCFEQEWLELWRQLAGRYFYRMAYPEAQVEQMLKGIRQRLGRRQATRNQVAGFDVRPGTYLTPDA